MNPDRFARLQAVLARRQPTLTVLMEQVHKPHNLSAILRNCDAVGVLEAHAVPAEQDRLKTHMAVSAGASKWVPVHVHDTIADAVDVLHADGFRILAAHPDADALDYRTVDMTGPTCLLVGAELHGVSEAALELADQHVVLPMHGMVRSLNVSVAAALLLYEAQRQRDAAGMYDTPQLAEPEFTRRLFEWAYPEVARTCRERGDPYPALTEDGELAEHPLGDRDPLRD